MKKTLNSEQLTEIVKSKNLDLPIPRLETRNFYQYNCENKLEFKVFSYYLLVFEPLVGKIEVSILNESVATLPIKCIDDKFYIGWRREGDILNLMTQLDLPAFIVDHYEGKYKEIFLSESNCPNGLKNKVYSPFFKKLNE